MPKHPCDLHYTIVATKPGEFPGAYASCVDEPQWAGDFAVRELAEGATLKRVTCNQAKALMDEYLAWCDAEDAKAKELKRVAADVAVARRKALALPIPRNECPGCFSAIYEGAADQGWCTDCFPHRKRYEKSARSDRRGAE